MPVVEGVALEDVGVDCRDAVDRIRRITGDPRHVHAPSGERRHVVDLPLVAALVGELDAEPAVDFGDDLHDAREDLLENRGRPRFQGLGENRVVGVGEGALHDFPCVFPRHAVLVQQQAHEFGNGQHRMRVVELDRVVLAEVAQVLSVVSDVGVDHRLQRRRNEEVLLAHAQDLALVGRVVRVKDAAQVGHALALDDRVGETLGVEGVVVEFLDGLGLPQAKRVDVLRPVAGDRHVVGHRAHMHVSEMDVFGGFFVADDEGVALLHPGVGMLVLEAVVDRLLEEPVAVENSVARHREVHRRAGIQETCGQAAQASVAQGCVGFGLEDVAEALAVGFKGGAGVVEHAQIDEVVEQCAAFEELRGKVGCLPAGLVGAVSCVPGVGDAFDDEARKARPELHLGRVSGGFAGGGADECGQWLRQIGRHDSPCELKGRCELRPMAGTGQWR